MSDLAPFVAAVVRDPVVVDLLQENEKLKEVVRKSRTIQLVLRNMFAPETVVLAQGQLEEGKYLEGAFRHEDYVVKLSIERAFAPHDLRRAHLTIGGHTLYSSHVRVGVVSQPPSPCVPSLVISSRFPRTMWTLL